MKTDNQKSSLKKQQKPIKNYLHYSGLAFQFMAALLLGYWLGKWLDAYYLNQKPWFTMGLMLFFILATLAKVIRDVLHE